MGNCEDPMGMLRFVIASVFFVVAVSEGDSVVPESASDSVQLADLQNKVERLAAQQQQQQNTIEQQQKTIEQLLQHYAGSPYTKPSDTELAADSADSAYGEDMDEKTRLELNWKKAYSYYMRFTPTCRGAIKGVPMCPEKLFEAAEADPKGYWGKVLRSDYSPWRQTLYKGDGMTEEYLNFPGGKEGMEIYAPNTVNDDHIASPPPPPEKEKKRRI